MLRARRAHQLRRGGEHRAVEAEAEGDLTPVDEERLGVPRALGGDVEVKPLLAGEAELDKANVEEIGRKYPNVPRVIREFAGERAMSPEETTARQDIELPLGWE